MFLTADEKHITAYGKDGSSVIVCSENKKEYRAVKSDNDTAYRYKIDGGIITGNGGERCDYIVENEDKKHLYFVELKGCDFPKACSQILSTITRYKQETKDFQIHARIVLSRKCSHGVKGEKYRSLKKICPDALSKNRTYQGNI